MDDMVMLELRPMEQIPNDSSIIRDLNTNRVFDCPHRGQIMRHRSDASCALGKERGVSWISSFQDNFNASEQLPGTPGVHDFSSCHFNFNAQMTFNPGNGLYGYFFAHRISSLSLSVFDDSASMCLASIRLPGRTVSFCPRNPARCTRCRGDPPESASSYRR